MNKNKDLTFEIQEALFQRCPHENSNLYNCLSECPECGSAGTATRTMIAEIIAEAIENRFALTPKVDNAEENSV